MLERKTAKQLGGRLRVLGRRRLLLLVDLDDLVDVDPVLPPPRIGDVDERNVPPGGTAELRHDRVSGFRRLNPFACGEHDVGHGFGHALSVPVCAPPHPRD